MKKIFVLLGAAVVLAWPLSAARQQTTAAATSLVVSAGAARLVEVFVYNAKTSAQFIQVHNAAALPAEAAVPVYSFTVPASSQATYFFGEAGEPFSSGIVLCNSSTQPTKTIGSADCWFVVRTK